MRIKRARHRTSDVKGQPGTKFPGITWCNRHEVTLNESYTIALLLTVPDHSNLIPEAKNPELLPLLQVRVRIKGQGLHRSINVVTVTTCFADYRARCRCRDMLLTPVALNS